MFIRKSWAGLVALLIASPIAFTHDGAKFEPPDGMILHGAGQDQKGFDEYASAVGANVQPFIAKEYYSLYDRTSEAHFPDVGTISDIKVTVLESWLAAQTILGTMPEIGLSYALFPEADGTEIRTSELILAGTLDLEIRAVANAIKDFGAPAFVRPGFEPLTPKYLPGSNHYTGAYRHIVDIFREEGVKNVAFIWCTAPLQGNNMILAGQGGDSPWFPGDAYVDWIGIDVFFESTFSHSSVTTMLDLAEKWKKPVILAETTARFDPIPPATMHPGITPKSCGDTNSMANFYWDNWFGPFFQFMRDNPRIKAFAYINWYWPDHGFDDEWGDTRIQNCTELADRITTELSDAAVYIHRDTPVKFNRPWLTDLGASVDSGGNVTITGQNAGTWIPGTDAPPVVSIYGSSRRWLTPSADPLTLEYCLGVELPSLPGQYLFLDGMIEQITPTSSWVAPNGNFGLTVPAVLEHEVLPPGATGWFQAAIQEPNMGPVIYLTQPFKLTVQ